MVKLMIIIILFVINITLTLTFNIVIYNIFVINNTLYSYFTLLLSYVYHMLMYRVYVMSWDQQHRVKHDLMACLILQDAITHNLPPPLIINLP